MSDPEKRHMAREYVDEILKGLENDPESTLDAYCHEGLDVSEGFNITDEGEEQPTGRWIASLCSLNAEGATAKEAIKALAAKLIEDIKVTGALGC